MPIDRAFGAGSSVCDGGHDVKFALPARSTTDKPNRPRRHSGQVLRDRKSVSMPKPAGHKSEPARLHLHLRELRSAIVPLPFFLREFLAATDLMDEKHGTEE
ncbi:MAG: hypothetical protein WD066_12535 [Planctomycetaceae bacterium]